jgi:hypothetical protein
MLARVLASWLRLPNDGSSGARLAGLRQKYLENRTTAGVASELMGRLNTLAQIQHQYRSTIRLLQCDAPNRRRKVIGNERIRVVVDSDLSALESIFDASSLRPLRDLDALG